MTEDTLKVWLKTTPGVTAVAGMQTEKVCFLNWLIQTTCKKLISHGDCLHEIISYRKLPDQTGIIY